MANWSPMRDHTRKAVNSFPGIRFLEGARAPRQLIYVVPPLGLQWEFWCTSKHEIWRGGANDPILANVALKKLQKLALILHRNSISDNFFQKSARLFEKAINTLASQRVVYPLALRAKPRLYHSSRYMIPSLTSWRGSRYGSKLLISPAKEGCNFGAFRAVPATLQYGPQQGHKPEICSKKRCLTLANIDMKRFETFIL